MSKQFSIERRIRNLKRGEDFIVKTHKERLAASRAALMLYKAGVITFKVRTIPDMDGFKVAAI